MLKSTTSRALRVVLLVALLGVAGCGGDDDDPTIGPSDGTAGPSDGGDDTATSAGPGEVVDVTARNYAFEGVPTSVAAGTELTLSNVSDDEVHEVVALRIDDDDARPLDELVQQLEDGSADGSEAVLTFVGAAVALPGSETTVTPTPIALETPGRYALVCLVPTGADPGAYERAVRTAQGERKGALEVEGGVPHVARGMYDELLVE